jgi:hypothetical protein
MGSSRSKDWGPVPSLDTFTSNAEKHGIEGSALCTIPAVGAAGGKRPNPLNPNGWLSTTPSAHGNWARIATNKYAYTMVRTIFDENGRLFGWAKFWGTVTPVSANEYTGQMNVQYYLPDGTPLFPQTLTWTMHSRRIEIIPEQ